MKARVLKSSDDIDGLVKLIRFTNRWPLRVTITDAKEARTSQQNRLVHKWFGEIARELGDTTGEEVKAQCNLTYGKPILSRDDAEWAAAFGYIFEDLSHAAKLKAIRVFDLPFTRLMNVSQLSEYMDNMSRDYRQAGIYLSDPELQGMEEWR